MRPERLSFYISSLGLLAVSLLAFTKSQKDWIDRRDDHQCAGCRAGIKHRCSGRLERHHILPQAYCDKLGIDPDFGENGILICQSLHRMIHEDLDETLKNYHKLKAEGIDPFKKLRQERTAKLKQNQIYWNSRYDRQLQAYSTKATQRMRKNEDYFPFSGKQEDVYHKAEL